RRPGALWAVGRQVNPQHRESRSPRAEDYVWEGHELDDCLEAANAVLEDDAVVSEEIGATEKVRPFRRDELLAPLEKFFFGRRRRRHRLVLGECADRHAPLARLQLVDALQVVLNRLGECRSCHGTRVTWPRWRSAWDTAPTPTTRS